MKIKRKHLLIAMMIISLLIILLITQNFEIIYTSNYIEHVGLFNLISILVIFDLGISIFDVINQKKSYFWIVHNFILSFLGVLLYSLFEFNKLSKEGK